MIFDTSAAFAVLNLEEDSELFARAMYDAPHRLMSAGNYQELGIVAMRQDNPIPQVLVSDFVRRSHIEIVPVDKHLVEMAWDAYYLYGKGFHPAALNFGDCFAYALAFRTGEALLFKGRDFTLTDVRSAL